MANDTCRGQTSESFASNSDFTSNISAALGEFLKHGKIILEDGIAEFNRKDSLENFISSKVGKMFQLAKTYNTLFRSIGSQNRKELDLQLGKHFRNTSVKELANNLIEFEIEWDQFLHTVDAALHGESHGKTKTLEVGDYLSQQLTVVDVLEGNSGTLDKLLPVFTSPYLLLVLQRHFA
ncbi:Hypothetical predicted protein [Octopus vulgaris]|uniref:Uncharacterized protein n=1 Tax=Octopus vulgaris TaxID=6645 RepID=A0AA36BAX3_OCTVU|nr:Hypothetical predicted protein [Octopus vulgaris]